MIEFEQVSKRFGQHYALRQVSFQLGRGQVVGLLGPNGAGKTTAMRLMTGFWQASSGQVRIQGQELLQRGTQARSDIGYLPERTPLYDDMTVLEFLENMARLKLPRPDRKSAVRRVIGACALQDVLKKLVRHLSKGFRQRTCLAQALLADPPILVLDEPTTGLDPNQVLDLRALLSQLAQTKTIVLSTHILDQVPQLCSRVLLLSQGRLVFDGSPQELMSQAEVPSWQLDTSAEEAVVAAFCDERALAYGSRSCAPEATTGSENSLRSFALHGAWPATARAALVQHLQAEGFEVYRLECGAGTMETAFANLTREAKP